MEYRKAIHLPDVMYDAVQDCRRRKNADPAGYRCNLHTFRFVLWCCHVRCGNEPPADLHPDIARYHGLPFEIDNRMPFGEFDLIPTGCIVG
jgi:hypothetical protein